MKKHLALFLSILLSASIQAQSVIGFSLPPRVNHVTFPFEFINNLIVIPISINGNIKLKFILDSGASTPILTERVFGDIMGLAYDRSIFITGPGIKDSVTAYVANKVTMELPGGIVGDYISMLVLEEDYIELKKNLGEEVYGIIGYEIFSRFVVDINYDKLEITLHRPGSFDPPRRFKKIPITIQEQKPYIFTNIIQDNQKEKLKMLVDTGASHAMLLDVHKSEVLHVPDTTIPTSLGYGLGGEIPGKIGRLEGIAINKFQLDDILVSIPEKGAYSNAVKRGSRNGTIGGHLLGRFHPIFDYKRRTLYLSKGKEYKTPFEYDMSGLRISYFDNPPRMEVTAIMPNSPVKDTPIQIGDTIQSINGKSLETSKLSEIYYLLRRRDGKKIRVRILDEGEIKKYIFRLRRLI
jgi:hypothetical protein